jgi:hypothetical protein
VGQALQVRRADGEASQFPQVFAGLLEGRGLAGLADRLLQQGGTIALGAQLQLVIQREKKRPDRSYNATARGPG